MMPSTSPTVLQDLQSEKKRVEKKRVEKKENLMDIVPKWPSITAAPSSIAFSASMFTAAFSI
jgi:hypothetical protein